MPRFRCVPVASRYLRSLTPIRSGTAVWVAFAISLFPILRGWDEQLWPNESALATRIERRNESIQLQELAVTIRSKDVHPFLAPWWLSPSIAYWSGQPGVAGSSHEALDGSAESARFFLTNDLQVGREILRNRHVDWVLAYDWERVAQISADLLAARVPDDGIGRILDRTPGLVPPYLVLSGQNQTAKLFRFADKL